MNACPVLFQLVLMSGLTLAVSNIAVKLHQPVTLPCRRKCSDSLRWFLTHNRETVMAECDRTSCQVKDGFEMSHEQFLKGNLSLTITAADYGRRTWYTCQCDRKDVCDFRLLIEPVMSWRLVRQGEDLVMSLPIPEPVDVIYYTSDSTGSSGQKVCRVQSSGSLQCEPKYRHRVSFSPSDLTLKKVTLSDCGSYTVRDTENNEDIHTYTIYMAEKTEQVSVVSASMIILVLVLVISLVLTGMNVHLIREVSALKVEVKQNILTVKKENGIEKGLLM